LNVFSKLGKHGLDDHRGRQSFPERAVEFRLGKIGACLLQDLIGLAQFSVLALQFLNPALLFTAQTSALASVALGTLAPAAKAVWRAA
jgi:hypothetical protein